MVRARFCVDFFNYYSRSKISTHPPNMARQNFIGLVVSQGKMNKTVKVRVQTKGYDKRVHKEVLKRKDYLVHDEGNLCKEGDIVRIESIPKITERKYFAVAQIKVNKGQQFAAYQELAKKKVQREEEQKLTQFFERRNQYEKVVNKIEDLKKLDQLTKAYQNADAEKRLDLLLQINEIKQRYNITSWPSTQPLMSIGVNETAEKVYDSISLLDEAEFEKSIVDWRLAHIREILDEMMSEEWAEWRAQILEGKVSERSAEHTKRNILRKWVLDPKNDLPWATEEYLLDAENLLFEQPASAPEGVTDPKI